MRKSPSFGSGMSTGILLGLGFIVTLVLGIGLLVLGIALGRSAGQPVAMRPTATITPAVAPLPTATILIIPSATPLPTATPLPPTQIPPTATPQPLAVAGAQGANIRSGPGTNFSIVGRVDPGTQLPIIGRYADWWQILYNGAPAWIADLVVTTSNTESVSEVVPPPSPIPPPPAATAAPTAVQPTAGPVTVHGLQVNGFWVEGGQGPFGVNAQIWFNMDVTNVSGQPLAYNVIGVAPKPTTGTYDPNSFHTSYNYTTFAVGQRWQWRDYLRIPIAGTYTLVLTIQFSDGEWAELGFATVIVQ